MPIVTVMPQDLRIEVKAGEYLAQAAWRQRYHWPTTCWGEAQCMVCAVRVVGGGQAVEPPTADEVKALRERMPRFLQQPQTRLACRLRVNADGAVVERRLPDIGLPKA